MSKLLGGTQKTGFLTSILLPSPDLDEEIVYSNVVNRKHVQHTDTCFPVPHNFDQASFLNLNLNLNSLLVKRQIDNPSPGAVTGGN